MFGSWLGVGDEGLLDLDFEFRDMNTSSSASTSGSNGSTKGDGAELEMDIEVDASTNINGLLHLNEEEESLSEAEADLPFKISNTHFTLPHTLSITPHLRTLPSRTILSTFTKVPRKLLLALLLRPVVLPLAKIAVRRELESAIGQGIEQASEVVSRTMIKTLKGARLRARERAMKIKAEADALTAHNSGELGGSDNQSRITAQVGFGDVWDSFVEVLGDLVASIEDAEPEVEVHTTVKEVGLKGVQLERIVVESDHIGDDVNGHEVGDNSGEQAEGNASATTTTIAIGLAPQLLPNKADLVSSSSMPSADPTAVVDKVITETQTTILAAADDVVDGVKDGLEQGVEEVREIVQSAAEVAEGVREGVEEVGQGIEQGRGKVKVKEDGRAVLLY